ncbi:binding partner of ACD11 1 isoform X2 [Aegilops tauschii subsp. strangulata]|uniref:binding partner of ACD11 1 isoform X2 n=1 Tax=Aegilops tauschii subsp. strangulata TaxID=200361 RepID=UPI001ABCA9FF|nr:binding partner of ACD11 1 isoform X2 [Aegilops tauschii subsp. strangulata]
MEGRRGTRTVRVRNISDLAREREVREFFSFSGEIDHVDITPDRAAAPGRTAYVTFKDAKALEIALLLSYVRRPASTMMRTICSTAAPSIALTQSLSLLREKRDLEKKSFH